MMSDVLTDEGVIANYAIRESSSSSDWATYTLAGATGANNLPGGDLELASAGTTLTISESTTANFAAGTRTIINKNPHNQCGRAYKDRRIERASAWWWEEAN